MKIPIMYTPKWVGTTYTTPASFSNAGCSCCAVVATVPDDIKPILEEVLNAIL